MRIAIVGAGLSGRLVLLHLCRRPRPDLDVVLIDPDLHAMGPAYSSDEEQLLLNVPAGQMSAFDDDRNDFVDWVRGRHGATDAHAFLPRRLYREYVLERLGRACRSQPLVHLEQRRAEVTDIVVTREGVRLTMAGGQVTADKAVLALGNFPPRPPRVSQARVRQAARYLGDPWRPQALDVIAPTDRVLLIGTGQTATDLVVTLARREHQGPIVALSRHGLLPLAHASLRAYPSFLAELTGADRVVDLFGAVRRHLRRAAADGFDARAVIDSLRPGTQDLWMGLPEAEKEVFLRHLFRHWEVVRSRIPPQNDAVVTALRASGRLTIAVGRVTDLVPTPAALEVRHERDGETCTIRADVVIDCMGPEADYGRIEQPLVRNLLRHGLVRRGPAGLGIDALPDGTVLDRDGRPSRVLSTLGPPLRGVLWETIAVPEIRVQARRLAERLAGD